MAPTDFVFTLTYMKDLKLGYICVNVDTRSQVFIDIVKTFDRVSHGGLVMQIEDIG